MKSIAVTEAREHFADLIHEVSERKQKFIIERRGKPCAVVVPLEDLEPIQGRVDQILHEGQQRLKDFADSSSDWFWEMDANGRFSYFSSRFTVITGVPQEALLGKTTEETGIPDVDSAEWEKHLADLAAHRSFRNFQHPRSRADGQVVHLSISGKAVFDEADNFQGYRGTGADISERKQVERELERSREQLRAVFENTPVCLNLKDTEGRYILVNKPYEEWLGHPAEEIIGKKASEFLEQEDEVESITQVERQVLETGEGIKREVRTPRPDGPVYDRIVIKFPVKSADGSIAAIGTVAVDISDLKRIERELRDARDDLEVRVEERTRELTDEITERKRMEEALVESEERFRVAFEYAPIGVALITPDGNRFKVNKALADFLGYSVEELTDTKMSSTAADLDDLSESLRLRRQVLDGKITTYRNERRYRHKQGHIVWGEVSGSLFRNEDGEPEHFIAHTIDITERKRAEEELAALNENLEKRVEERTVELRAAQADLLRQERLATLGQLTATVSHELRNPLGVIRTSNFIVGDGLKEITPRVQRALERIDRSVIRCDRIIDELLDFTRISGLEPEPTPIDAWLDGTLKEQALPAEITLRRDFGLAGTTVPFDRDRFRRAIINVFDNACQAMTGEVGREAADADNAVLSVKTQRKNGRVEVIFEDRGPGIPADVLPRIFEPLFSTKGFGVGLGLPVVKRIMEQHGGGIEIDGAGTSGTRVCLWLPAERPTRPRT